MTEWHKPEDKMPTELDIVLVLIVDEALEDFIPMTGYVSDGKWEILGAEWTDEIIYWAEIPELPKEWMDQFDTSKYVDEDVSISGDNF